MADGTWDGGLYPTVGRLKLVRVDVILFPSCVVVVVVVVVFASVVAVVLLLLRRQ